MLRDMLAYAGHPVTRAALSLSALLLLRPGELRHMEWTWIDLDGATLTVPGEVMKRSKAGRQGERSAARRAAGTAGRGYPARAAPADRAWPLRVALTADRRALHERKHRARCAAPHGLRQ
ncbi:hypothetical protein [Methylibium sp.]|uniref:hypothetical protein n=1 Tax=Methylibium sp. TaxID=2067992 RepID=UPI0018473581|nr:hypothetical protein [Methylibium sp.]MBA3591795.1 hypothetical protein [Methylibium sp.]